MRRKIIWTVLAIVFANIALHLNYKHEQNGLLLIIDEQPVDAIGNAKNLWNKVSRNCTKVSRLNPGNAHYQESLTLIKNYSPPSSASARIKGLWSVENWTLAEVEFEELLPAVILIKKEKESAYIVPNAVWSAHTQPWHAASYIRQFMTRQAHDVAPNLINCFDPQSSFYQY